ncbi:MAG: hypothetical protein JWM93_2889 [Frankiales bacterium]|nr:hypothetical protein [Frankiales bacterium]
MTEQRESATSDDVTPEGRLEAVQERLLAAFGPQVGNAAVHRSVSMAVQAVQFFGDEPELRSDLVERIARNELELLQEGRNERAWT